MAHRENRLEANMDTRIAVIGMSAILPCGTTVRESWEAIRDGIDCLSDLPEDRVDVTAYFDPVKTTKDKIYCKRGGFIPEYDFDAREFGLNMFQMEDSDANQTVTLLKVKEALEDAGIEALSKEKKNIGCVLGIGGGQKSSHEFYSRLNYVVVEKVLRKMGMPEEDVQAAVEKYKANFPEWRLDSFPGFLGNVTAGRCTNTFNLDGMNCVVDAACASSLIAVKVAIDELLHGDCDMMITGATCTDNSIGMYMAFSKTPVFSTDPSVRAYDEKTKGMLIGEGSAMLVLKRYADAVRDGDEIHAVIRGCASSSDGKASGIYTPTISGQEEALRRAYMRANVDPATVTLVEGHGTGTPVGDRIELTALRNLFDSAYGNEKEKVAVGSIKSNIGHLKAVAGLAGMIKVIMALKHKTLPATINVDEPPKLYDNTPITDSSLYINTMNRPWFPAPGVPRRAGISSFGFGGANYHAVLEEAEPEHQKAYRLNRRPQPVLLMASSTQALASLCEAQLKEFEKAIEENKTVKNTAYIKCVDFCEKFKFPGSIPSSNARLGFLVKEADDATETLRAIVAQFQKSAGKDSWHLPRQGVSFRAQGINTTGGVAALFSGQGAQYTHMFSEVAMNWPQFRESISDMDRAQAKVAGADKDYERVSQVLYPRKPYNSEPEQDHKKISLTSYSQPSTLACALGAYEIFKQAGFKPDFAAGHSLGEFAALYAADCVNRDDLFELVCRRARIMGGKDAPATPKGCMAAVIGPNAEKIQIRTADVWLGNCNSPSQTVITGSVEGIKKESELLQREGFRVVPLACESAFHSPQMQNASSAFKDVLSKVAFRQPSAQTKLFSNVSGETYSNNAQDLLKEHMTSSVKFISQVRNMHSAGARIFVEFGPKQVLSKLVSETLKDDPSIITISVNPSSGKDADIQLREAAVQLVVAGVNLQGFDKWDAPDATRLQPIKKKKTTLRLSAATYVSDKTKRAREAAMNDGRMLSCVSKVIAPPAAKPIVDTKAQEEVARLQKQLQDAQAQIQKAKADAAEADKKLAAAKDEAKRAAASAPVQKQVDTTIVDKHRAILKSMLAELDCYSTPGAVSSSFQAPVAAAPAPVAAAPAPVAAAAPAANSALLAKAETVVMEVLAAKTGYETDMIEPDMELETELGIDSIKRVEILSEVQAQLNVEAKDVDALSRTRTVGEVVNAMKAEIAGSSGAAAAAPAPVAAAPAPVAAAAPAVSSALLAKAETVVMEVLAAKTGYETDMIEPDMELETELGIDSIKRVEILSEVQAQLNVEAKDVDALSRTRTVGEVVNAMKAEIAGSSGAAAAAPAPVAAAPAPVAAAAPAANSALLAKAESVVMEVLAAKTGYETDMIEADMELETELGIDSIKRVEILSEVQAQLNVEAKDVDALSRTRTVGEVVNAMKAEIAGSSGAAAAAPAPVATAPAPVAAAAPAVSSALLEKAESVVMEVLAAKTGYETDMIEADMELETELGIDSIKRVEILSEVQAQLNVEAKDVDALSRTRTVGEVVNAMKAEIAGSSGAAAAAPAPVAAAPAPVAAAAPAANSALLAKAETVVMEVLAAKTGYETDMIEPDMELETELGIDSIKRVEILSEVQAQLNVEAKDVDALSRTRTVGEVVNAMKAEIAGSSGAAAAAPAPVAAAPAPVAAAAPAVSSALLEKAESVVMEVLAAKTGYETDMIEADMELETELGIDSIKRVEILSEVQAQLNVEAKDVDALSRTRTVGEVVNAMKAEIAGSSGAATASAPAAAAPAPVAAAAPAVNSALLAKAESVVMEVLAAKTGYETDMIEADMELETELGIDSIKRVEILSEVQAQLNVEAKDVDALSRTRTVGEVVNAMKAEIAGSSGAAAAAPAPVAAAPAPVAAAAPAVSSALLEKAESVVMEVLAAKTGYETDMIEADMELETELGIDSIKRVEILSEVQAMLNVEAKDVDALSRTRTVGEVVNAMKAEIASSSGAAAPAPAAAAAPAPAAAPAVSSALLEKAESVVMEVLAAKTGYETDMIEADMELETELGIDSIKRVEILSEVQAMLNVEAKDVDALSRTRTVGEVVNAMKAEIASSSGAAAPAPAAAAAPAPAAAPAVSSALLEKAESVVMEVLAAKTGYETDMIEADMELETELGIDSIKRVEILSEVQAMLNVEAKDVDALSRTRTVGEVVNAMKAEIAGSSGAATASAPAAAAAAPAIKISTVHGADCDDLSVMSAELVDIRRADELLLERPENRPVLIVDDGTELTSALVRVLGAGAVVLTFDGLQLAQRAGAAVRHVQVKDLSAESAEKAIKEAEQRFGQLGGFISQQAERFAPADILGFTLMCAKFAKASLCTPVQGGRAFFIGVARLDGRLGFTSQGSTDSLTRAQRGAIFGLCKTIGLEWSANEVFARGIDIAREVHPEDAAVAITREMSCADNRIREVGIGLNQKRCTIRAVDLKPGAPKIQISQDDVLLVSGGARGITPLCIREITRQVRGGKYILLGRSKVPAGEPAWCNGVSDDDLGKAAMQELKRAFSAGEGPKPTPMTHKKLVGTIAGAREVRSSIANIEALGGKAIYSSCDVNSAADVAKAVREAEAQLGARVTGVVHASGVLRDRLIEQKRPDEFDAVFGTKVTGLENLFGAIDMANLKHLVLFSSLAGFHGNIGQSDYAMANEALNKMGLELSDRVSVKSICFGPWDGGMVTPQLKKQFQSMGVQIIPREGGADTVARIVLGSSPAEILVGNWTTPTKKVGSEPVVIHRKISAASNPFLKDHVIQGRCVLPMTIAVGCLAETCLGQFPGYSLWAIEDAQLFKGVTVDGDVNCEITLKPSQGTAGRVMIQATLKTFASGKLVPAYRAVIVLSTQGKPPAATTSQTPSLQADPAARGNPYDGKTLFHGPAFQGLKEIISCNKSQLVAECTFIPSSESAGEFASDYESHNPFVNDIAFQAMLVWIRRTLGQAALPNSIQRIVQHRALPQDKPFYLTLKSNSASGHSQHKTSVQFHNEQGDLFVDIQASVTSSDSLAF